MAIAFDNSNSVASWAVSSVTIPAFAVAGDFIFVGAVSWDTPARTLSSVTRNSGAEVFTEAFDLTYSPSGQETGVGGAYFIAPAAGTYSIVVTFSAAPVEAAIAGAVSLTGVHQTTPLGTYQTEENTTGSPSVSCTAADDEWLIDVVSGDTLSGGTLTPGADQTGRWEQEDVNGSYYAGSSTQPGTADDVMSYTETGKHKIVAIPVKPAPSAERVWLMSDQVA